MLNWDTIDTVLLDMDGTLLDLHYDTYFWLEHLPARYAETHGISAAQARAQLHKRIIEEQGSLNWYCVDFWSAELGVDIGALKREISHKVAFRPYVKDFLSALREAGLRSVIVTNCHRTSLQMKLEQTGLDRLVDGIVCSHDFKVPKEDVRFWDSLQHEQPFDRTRTLLVDDSLAVLRSAAHYGIRHLLTIYQPDSRQPARAIDEFPGIDHFDQIHPGVRR
ncbi:GMP/IMP nucleotidase [Motiliproteus sp. SC1-56]|uniref:GMP/IMP nucleotidase n=1 Tax=Motiliproteus sp. SC1-56 TaxID=2799565 RepID=UPI001A8E3843|nr:GMP/IMP nucleotidase [Motiliproteus sp. SC1-56]